MHLWPGNGVAIESAIVFYARAAHTLVQELNVGTVWGSKSPYNPRNIRGSDAV